MNETLDLVTGDNSDAVIDFGYWKNFHNWLSDYDNKNLYTPIIPTLSEDSAISMIADEDTFDHIPKKTHIVIEVMVVLMVLLLILKLVQSGVHHTFGAAHDIVCILYFLLRATYVFKVVKLF